MTVTTFEGVVDNGQIKLKGDIRLPDKTVVFVIIPNFEIKITHKMISPRLLKREQIVDFQKQMKEVMDDPV